MSQINWQAYLDGSMSLAEKQEAEVMLRDDESARKELEGLKSFVGYIKDSALDEGIPLSRLESMIASATPSERPKLTLLSWKFVAPAMAVAATILIGMIWMSGLIRGPRIEFVTTSPLAASAWATDQTSLEMPVIELGSDAPMTKVHVSADHCCFDYKYKNQLYHVNVYGKGKGKGNSGTALKLVSGLTAFQTKGIAWTQGDWDFYVSGKGTEFKEEIANRVTRLISNRT